MENPVEPSKAVVSESKRGIRQWRPSRPVLIITGVVLLILALALISAFIVKKNNKEEPKVYQTTKYVCTGDLLTRATLALGGPDDSNLQAAKAQTQTAPDYTNLQKVTDEIKTKPDYGKDPNCLYILTRYSVAIGDADSAQKYLTQYQLVLSTQDKQDDTISFTTQQNDNLKKSVESLKKRADTFKQNNAYGPNYKHPEGYTNPNTNQGGQ